MTLMNTAEVAEYLGVSDSRVARLSRERLLVATEQNEKDEPLFNQEDVEKYKELAERLGGI